MSSVDFIRFVLKNTYRNSEFFKGLIFISLGAGLTLMSSSIPKSEKIQLNTHLLPKDRGLCWDTVAR